MSERLKIVRSPVRSRPKPQVQKLVEGKMLQKKIIFLMNYGYLYRWALVGITTLLFDYMIFLSVFYSYDSVYIANFLSGLVSISFNYAAHYFWSFKSKSNHTKSGVRYMINLILFWVFGTFILKFLISSGIEAKYAKLMPIPIIAPLSFISLRFFVFKSKINK